MADLTAIVVNFNTRDLLRTCLRSILSASSKLESRQLSYEIVVVDNASSDCSSQMVRTTFPDVRLLANEKNLGFAEGCNLAIKESQGSFVFLMNPDVEVLDDALALTYAFIAAHPEAGAVGPQLYNLDRTIQDSSFRFPNAWMSLIDFFPLNHRLTRSRLNGRYPSHTNDEPYEIDHPLGAAIMLRRDALDKVGLMDEDLFMYCEEVELCMRLKRAGYKNYCLPSAHFIHHGGQSTGQRPLEMFVELHRSRFKLFDKYYSPGFQNIVRLFVRCGLIRRSMEARIAFFRREIDRPAFMARLAAYREVGRM